MDYSLNKASEEVLENTLQLETRNFIHNYLINSFDWYDLAQEWRNHKFSYDEKGENSEKTKHAVWAAKNLEAIESLLEPSRKFIIQLNKIFSQEAVDLKHVLERIEAATNYFLLPMDNLVFELLWKLEEVIRLKKVKAFHDELVVLEELQIKAVLRLMKAKMLVETVATGQEISKEKLSSESIKYYKINKLKTIQEDFKSVNVTLIEDEADLNRYAKKKKSAKEVKKSTVQETYELWLEKNTIKEIAAIRKFSPETILGHLTKLIIAQTISINDVLPEEKIVELTEAFKGYKEETVSPIKEKYGEKFTWEELRMFKASLNLQ
jgi:uncharacterized protein YpbB